MIICNMYLLIQRDWKSDLWIYQKICLLWMRRPMSHSWMIKISMRTFCHVHSIILFLRFLKKRMKKMITIQFRVKTQKSSRVSFHSQVGHQWIPVHLWSWLCLHSYIEWVVWSAIFIHWISYYNWRIRMLNTIIPIPFMFIACMTYSDS